MKRIFKLLGILIGSVIIAFIILELIIISFGVNSKPKKSDAIIVLGCAVYRNFPSPFFRARLDEALRLYNKGQIHNSLWWKRTGREYFGGRGRQRIPCGKRSAI